MPDSVFLETIISIVASSNSKRKLETKTNAQTKKKTMKWKLKLKKQMHRQRKCKENYKEKQIRIQRQRQCKENNWTYRMKKGKCENCWLCRPKNMFIRFLKLKFHYVQTKISQIKSNFGAPNQTKKNTLRLFSLFENVKNMNS